MDLEMMVSSFLRVLRMKGVRKMKKTLLLIAAFAALSLGSTADVSAAEQDRVFTTPTVFGRVFLDANNNGTFLFDRNLKMVRMFENGSWVNLSDAVGNDIPSTMVNASNEVGKGVIIGAQSSSAKGVLVLESTNKAMILPHIKNPHTTVKSPYPGMMCYDTVSNSLAVYDGTRWNYWK